MGGWVADVRAWAVAWRCRAPVSPFPCVNNLASALLHYCETNTYKKFSRSVAHAKKTKKQVSCSVTVRISKRSESTALVVFSSGKALAATDLRSSSGHPRSRLAQR